MMMKLQKGMDIDDVGIKPVFHNSLGLEFTFSDSYKDFVIYAYPKNSEGEEFHGEKEVLRIIGGLKNSIDNAIKDIESLIEERRRVREFNEELARLEEEDPKLAEELYLSHCAKISEENI